MKQSLKWTLKVFIFFHFTKTGLLGVCFLGQLLKKTLSLLFPCSLLAEWDWIRSEEGLQDLSFNAGKPSSIQKKHVVCLWERASGTLHDPFEMEARASSEEGELKELPMLEFSCGTNFLPTVKSRRGGMWWAFWGSSGPPPIKKKKDKIASLSMLCQKTKNNNKKINLPEEDNLQNHR